MRYWYRGKILDGRGHTHPGTTVAHLPQQDRCCPPGRQPGMSWDTASTRVGITEPVDLSSYRMGAHTLPLRCHLLPGAYRKRPQTEVSQGVARVGGVALGRPVNTMQMRMTRLDILSSDSYSIPKAAVPGLG